MGRLLWEWESIRFPGLSSPDSSPLDTAVSLHSWCVCPAFAGPSPGIVPHALCRQHPSSVPCAAAFAEEGCKLHHLCSVSLTVNGPLQPVTAFLSKDIVLRCHLSPRTSAQDMEIKWFRPQKSSYVHLYHGGRDHLERQLPEYQGRTEFLKDGIGEGKIELKILNVSFLDEGQYHCSVKQGSFHQEATLDMRLAVSGTAPLIAIEGYQGRGIRVVCRSSGWYPKPEILWIDPSGRLLPAPAKAASQKNSGLFDVQNEIIVTGHSDQKLTCVVRNLLLNQNQSSTIHITDHFFQKVSPWIIGLSVSLIIAVLSLIVSVLYLLNGNSEYVANVTLDPDTANHDLILSPDQKNVIQGFMWHSLPDNPERFRADRCVLGTEGFSSGRHYWEVEVGEEGYWAVGVARQSVRRDGKLSLEPEEGIWAVEKSRVQYQALTVPETPLSLQKKPRKLGIYLDYEMQQVTFHDVNHKTHIYTFPSATFNSELIFPFLHVGVGCWLRLCP
uniref:Butyrophilin subfamily 1 member A1-like n=1 Tax=Varanus komodoensis TaxID=61221 RepID=A0A8D2LCJ7_VARKO